MEADGDEQTDIESLDRNISEEEVYEAIRMLKNGKAARPDGMISEFLKNSAGSAVPFLVRYLNKLFYGQINKISNFRLSHTIINHLSISVSVLNYQTSMKMKT